MKTTVLILLLTAGVFGLAGCASTSAKVSGGPVAAQTFQFVDTGKPLPAYADADQQVHARVQNAIAANLGRHGLRQVQSGGDVTVAYLIIRGDGAVTTSIDDFFGYGRDAYELIEKAHDKYIHHSNPNRFEAGTLLIDLIDSKTWKVVSRGHATRDLTGEATPEQRAARVNQAVEEIFSNVRFKQ